MDAKQAAFFRRELLPIARQAADGSSDPLGEQNPLRKMLQMALGYIDYLEAQARKEPTEG